MLAETDALYRNGSLIVVAFSLFAIILSALLAKIFVRPLKQLVASVQRFSDKQQQTVSTQTALLKTQVLVTVLCEEHQTRDHSGPFV